MAALPCHALHVGGHLSHRLIVNASPQQVSEQTLRALGVTKCADLLAKRGLLGALYSSIATDHFMAVALGVGHTSHSEPAKEGEAGRKGKSVERTFAAISSSADLEAKV